MKEIVFFLEEASAEAMLHGLLPKLLPSDVRFRCIVFEGKRDLDNQLVHRLRGYLNPNARFIILRDKDSADCRSLKQVLVAKCESAGRSKAIVRIACCELESWYLADLSAVDRGLGMTTLSRLQTKKKFRTPDVLLNAAEELKKIASDYQKIGGSRAIGPFLDPNNTRSRSFQHFVSAVRRLGEELSSLPGNQ